jgi:D-alanine-D-alanine ligase
MDKIRSKHLFRAVGVSTPDYEVIHSPGEAVVAADRLGYPLVLKPAGQGSSVGMSKVFDCTDLGAAAELALGFGEPAIVEHCVSGDEITVAVLQGEALPSIRIVTPRIFYDYLAKYEADSTQYFCPGTEDDAIEQQYRDIAVRAFAELGCSGWGRVDLMVGNDGVPQVLEVNTVPGMTSHSLVPMAAKAAGIDFAELCWRILETSVRVSSGMSSMGVAANDA